MVPFIFNATMENLNRVIFLLKVCKEKGVELLGGDYRRHLWKFSSFTLSLIFSIFISSKGVLLIFGLWGWKSLQATFFTFIAYTSTHGMGVGILILANLLPVFHGFSLISMTPNCACLYHITLGRGHVGSHSLFSLTPNPMLITFIGSLNLAHKTIHITFVKFEKAKFHNSYETPHGRPLLSHSKTIQISFNF